jgi:hypothetical protein
MACETCPPPTAQITSTNISCFGGSDGSYTISNGSGGSGTGYQVAISTDGFVTYYNLPKTFSGLLANTTYTFRVKDSTGATNDLTPAQLTQPTQQTASTTIITQPVCDSSGVIQITSSGGVFPKTYQIYEDNTFPYNDCTNGTLKQTFTNVTSGTPTRNVSGLTSSYSYCAKVTDANGCITTTNQVFLNDCVNRKYSATDCGTGNTRILIISGLPLTLNSVYRITGAGTQQCFTIISDLGNTSESVTYIESNTPSTSPIAFQLEPGGCSSGNCTQV